jgi:hypothetical protein
MKEAKPAGTTSSAKTTGAITKSTGRQLALFAEFNRGPAQI